MTANPDSFLQRLAESFPTRIRHCAALGLVIEAIAPDSVLASMPLREELLGDPERGLIHTGVIVALVDSIAGVAAMARIGKPLGLATLDLRVDYLRATRLDAGPRLHCRAGCYRLTSQIAFVRAEVWQADEAEPVATSLATFMLQPYPGQAQVIR